MNCSKFLLMPIFVSSMSLSACVGAAAGDMSISAMAGPWPITIRTCSWDAGAICSLTWRDKEFIDDFDHGRQLQSAVSFDNLGEVFNPTEAGSSDQDDGVNPSPSSSVLMGYWSVDKVLATQTNMAFFRPYNNQKVSDYILNKQVTIGAHNLPHVIQYSTQYTLPKDSAFSHGIFEVVTGYMPSEFSEFWTYDIKNKKLARLSDGEGEQGLPIIFSTPDEGWAMGIYSPGTPQPGLGHLGYGRGRFSDVVKWNNVYRIANPRGVYHFRSYVIVGSLENVRVSMDQLYDVLY
ncbi:hypothetical protein KW506_03415 [Vibrio fluvialis]|nr:hypothetical protein [Vibrio fluvialis]